MGYDLKVCELILRPSGKKNKVLTCEWKTVSFPRENLLGNSLHVNVCGVECVIVELVMAK